jgi:hypothetical protein
MKYLKGDIEAGMCTNILVEAVLFPCVQMYFKLISHTESVVVWAERFSRGVTETQDKECEKWAGDQDTGDAGRRPDHFCLVESPSNVFACVCRRTSAADAVSPSADHHSKGLSGKQSVL